MGQESDKQRVDFVLLISAFAVTLLILGAVTGLILDGLGSLHQGHADYQKNAQAIRDAASQEIAKTCVRLDGTVMPKCLEKEVGAYYQRQATNQDLKAQQDMAYWAMWLLVVGIGQAFISVFGIFFIWDSLRLSRVATKAALDANAVTREIGEAQSRAYLSVTKGAVRFRGGELSPIVVIWVKNTGQSPALNARVVCTAKRVRNQQSSDKKPDVGYYRLAMRIGANSEDIFEFDIPEVAAQPSKNVVAPERFDFRVDGFVEYQSVFGEIRREVLRDSFFAFLFADNTEAVREAARSQTPPRDQLFSVDLFAQVVPGWLDTYIQEFSMGKKTRDKRARKRT